MKNKIKTYKILHDGMWKSKKRGKFQYSEVYFYIKADTH